MNHYGHRAKQYWQANAPSRYASLEDPEEFFTDLGEQVAGQVEGISQHLEAKLPADLNYLERVGQLRAIQAQAEEVAMADLVTWVPVEPTDAKDELGDMLGALPTPDLIDRGADWIQERAWKAAEMPDDEATVILNDEDQEDKDALLRLRPLVCLTLDQVEEMSEQEAAERVAALRPWMANNPAEQGWHAAGPPANPGWQATGPAARPI